MYLLGALRTYVDTNTHTLMVDPYQLLILHPPLTQPTHSTHTQAITYIRIDGKTPADMRQALCDQFQHSEQCQVAVLSITTANAGTKMYYYIYSP